MQDFEYCEIWGADGGQPHLTFYKPQEDESHIDGWEDWKRVIAQLELSGWELASTAQPGSGLLFKRRLQ